MRNVEDGKLSAVGRVFVALVILLVLVCLSLAAMAVGIWVTLDQSRENKHEIQENRHHIDCLVSALARDLPEGCASVIEALRDEGILPMPTG